MLKNLDDLLNSSAHCVGIFWSKLYHFITSLRYEGISSDLSTALFADIADNAAFKYTTNIPLGNVRTCYCFNETSLRTC